MRRQGLGLAAIFACQKIGGSCVMKLTRPAIPSEPYSADAGPRTISMRLSSSEREVFAVEGGGAEGVTARHRTPSVISSTQFAPDPGY